ncbi:hypothetical protein Emed_000259 [Eimeria media]
MSADGQPDPAQVAIVELVGMSDMYKRMQEMCWTRCIPGIKGDTLDAGEASCIDRCVNKYAEVHTTLGKQLQEFMSQGQK